jgi:hypothetical protein
MSINSVTQTFKRCSNMNSVFAVDDDGNQILSGDLRGADDAFGSSNRNMSCLFVVISVTREIYNLDVSGPRAYNFITYQWLENGVLTKREVNDMFKHVLIARGKNHE